MEDKQILRDSYFNSVFFIQKRNELDYQEWLKNLSPDEEVDIITSIIGEFDYDKDDEQYHANKEDE